MKPKCAYHDGDAFIASIHAKLCFQVCLDIELKTEDLKVKLHIMEFAFIRQKVSVFPNLICVMGNF